MELPAGRVTEIASLQEFPEEALTVLVRADMEHVLRVRFARMRAGLRGGNL